MTWFEPFCLLEQMVQVNMHEPRLFDVLNDCIIKCMSQKAKIILFCRIF